MPAAKIRSMNQHARVSIAVLLFAIAALVGCGGGGGGASTPSIPSPVQSTAPPPPPASATPTVTVDASSAGITISPNVLGASLATWFDITKPFIEPSLANAGITLVRWPGGSESDNYHWANGGSVCQNGGYVYPTSTFDNVMQHDIIPANAIAAITVNYGSNAACNGGGDPNEAAAWVSYNKSHGYPARYWTVGNEVYGSWETDLHNPAHDPATYANAVATAYYPLMKAADSSAKIGVVVAGSYDPAWDQIVLKNAKYDFIELHYYAQAPGKESDSYLLGQGVTDFSNAIAYVRNELASLGLSQSIPIYVGELNTVYANPGKQTVSITNGLFAGMALGEMMSSGVPLSTWWIAYGSCTIGGNTAASLYGWQNFGSYALFSDGLPDGGCGSTIAGGTPFPAARAYALASQYLSSGSATRSATLTASASNLRVYADTRGTGYGFMLFNLNQSASQTVVVSMTNASRTSFTGSQITYGKTEYDQSQNGLWPGPATTSLGTVGTTFTVTLPPWSMTVVQLN